MSRVWQGLRQALGIQLAAILVAGNCLAAELPAMLEYQVGDQAEADIVTPIALVVFDPVRTEKLRRAEGQEVLSLFRFIPSAKAHGEAELKAAFAEARAKFTGGLERLFNHPLPLLTSELGQAHFAEFLKLFRAQRPGFPLSNGLAELWAFGDEGEIALDRQIEKWSRFPDGYVRADALPTGDFSATGSIRLVSIESTNAPLSLDAAEKQAGIITLNRLVPLSRFQADALKGATSAEQSELKYLASFLQPNCIFDEELTRQAWMKKVEAINAAEHYAAGHRIVRQGEIITTRTKLALDELQSRTAVDRVQASAMQERTRVEAEAAEVQRIAESTLQTNRWLLAGMGAAAVAILAVAILVFVRRKALLAAARGVTPAGAALAVRRLDNEDWRKRALAAEARADKATALLRTNMVPHMARWMMSEFMRKVTLQRRAVLTDQQKAEREVAELTERLEHVHAPLEERLRAYVKRIAELEAELAAKGEQNQALIKARIETTRKQLEGERSEETQESTNWS